jgi:hypothetical protein
MTQQVGSTSGTAPASRGAEVTSGGAPGTTQADWPEPGSTQPAGTEPASPQDASTEPDGPADGSAAARRRNWLRRSPPTAADVVPIAPSVVAAGPELDLASNDPLIGYLLSSASAVDITTLQLQSVALKSLRDAGVVLVVPLI